MIVFTATNLKTQDVYVGTAKESVEEEWADLLSQADNGASGQFFEQLRDHGSAGFEVDTWAYGENAAEARESMREAREDLGAQPIKSNRGQSAGRSTQAVQSASMKALMAVFEEALSNDGPLDEDEMLDGLSPSAARDGEADVEAEDDLDDDDDLKPAAKAAVPAVEKPIAKKGPAKAETAATSTADDEQKMLSRLEAMKAAQEKLLRQRDEPAGSSSSGVIGAKSAGRSAPLKAPKIATGRTGSAEKERRIREAIATERDRRDNLRHTSSREEQTEMNVVMARIELRRLATKKANAEKAKVQAAERRAKAKAEAISIAEALAKEMAANVAEAETGLGTAAKPAPTKPVAVKSAATKSATAKSAAAKASPSSTGATLKLAAGRTGSGQKEKRIREAIEQEKAERLAQQQSRRAAEAKEMAEIMARLEERTKEAEKLKRRR